MAQIDFPEGQLDQEFTAQNGIVYVCVGVNPTIWQVAEREQQTGQRLWARDGIEQQIFPVYPGDDVVIKDSAGNATTTITAGNQSKTPSLKTDNLLFAHMQPLP
jgi:hypothetical protein